MRPKDLLPLLLCSCSPSPPPECPSRLPSQVTVESNMPLTWRDEIACITVAYTPDLRDREGLIIDATAAWTTIDCGQTCFSQADERALPDDGRPQLYTIHITTPPEIMNPPRVSSTLTYVAGSAELRRALVEIDPDLDDPTFRRAMLRGFGRALGFDTPTSSVSSVLAISEDGLTEPTENDRQAYCSKYGVCLTAR